MQKTANIKVLTHDDLINIINDSEAKPITDSILDKSVDKTAANDSFINQLSAEMEENDREE